MAAILRRLDAIDQRLEVVEDDLELAKGRDAVYDRTIFGGPAPDGKRFEGLIERQEHIAASAKAAASAAAAAALGVKSLTETWAKFPRTVIKYAMRGLYTAIVCGSVALGFVFHNWDKIVRTMDMWRH